MAAKIAKPIYIRLKCYNQGNGCYKIAKQSFFAQANTICKIIEKH